MSAHHTRECLERPEAEDCVVARCDCACHPAWLAQPAPKPGRGDVWKMVIADMYARRQHGIATYGTTLQTDNGRDMLSDAYEEALDLCVYLRGALAERDDDFARVVRFQPIKEQDK